MTSKTAHVSARYSARAGTSVTMAIAILWSALMGFQLLRFIRIDAYELSQSRIDLLGLWMCFLISLLLGLWSINRGRMMLAPLFQILMLITHIILVITMTAPDQSIMSFLISRHGVVMWFVLGIGFSAVVDILATARRRGRVRYGERGVIVLLGVLGLLAVNFAREIFAEPVRTLSYQAVASSASILLLIAAGVAAAFWGRKMPTPFVIAYIAIGTALAAAVALTQSTLIVVLWLGILIVFFGSTFRESGIAGKHVIFVVLLLGALYFINTEVYDILTSETRFAVFFESSGEFTSLTSRIELVGTFADQFAVSPIFGNFKAELVSYVGAGSYIHSVPLSLLTHTGVLGTILFFSAFFLLIKRRTFNRSEIDFFEIQMGRMMWVVLGVGTISTFFSWPVIWFMLGTLCKRPMRLS